MKQFSHKLFLVFSSILFLSYCSDPVKVGGGGADISINAAWFDSYVDEDADGYYSSARIYFEVSTSKEVDVSFVIKYKMEGTSTYSVYKETAEYTISETETWYVTLGNSGFELPHGCYDFSIEVYSAGEMMTSLTAEQAPDIASFCMETPDEEVANVSLNDAWISDLYDLDANGYNSSANIYCELTTSQAINLYFVIRYKLTEESTYSTYKQTSEINNSGTQTWFISLGNSGYELPNGCYDFGIEVYSGATLLASINAQQDNSIASFCMETPEEDYINLRLNNTTYTVIDITVVNYGTQSLNPGESYIYDFTQYPGNLHIVASTSGKTSSDTQIGLLISWDFYRDMANDYETDLVVSTDYFFLKMRNAGPVDFSPIYVNWGLTDQTVDYILIPNNNVNYNTGYYRAYTDTEVRAYYYDDSGTYIYWFPSSLFSGEYNQLVELWWEGAGFGKQGITENWNMPETSEQLPVPQSMVRQTQKTKYKNPEYGVAR